MPAITVNKVLTLYVTVLNSSSYDQLGVIYMMHITLKVTDRFDSGCQRAVSHHKSFLKDFLDLFFQDCCSIR